MKKTIIFCASIICLQAYGEKIPNVLVLDDAERPRMSRWEVKGPISADVGVDYISSEKERKKVIRLRSMALNNEFMFRGEKGEALNITGFNVLEWKMNFTKPFMVKVEVKTTEGTKYLIYTDLADRNNTGDKYLHIGLGSRYRDGKWRTVIRDLEADMNSLIPNVRILSIQNLSFRGSGFLDDIWAVDVMPKDIVLEDGENNLKGWDRIGKGGTLDIDFDSVLGKIVKFDSGAKNVIFRLRKPDKSYWKIKTNVLLQWKIKTTASTTVYVVGESSYGKYTIAYTPGKNVPFYDKASGIIYYGLGDFTKEGVWRVFNRDLSDDIRRVLPGVDISSVGSVLLKGSGCIDDIRLLVQPPFDYDAIKGWEICDSDPTGASIDIVNDVEKGDVVQLSGAGIKNAYRFYLPTFLSTKQQTYLSWDIWFAEPFDMILAVDTGGLVRYIHYVAMDEKHEKIKNGDLYIGIGETKTDGKWHTINRNISEDVKKLGADVKYTSSNYFMIRGSGKIGKINFSEIDPMLSKQDIGPSATASMVLGQYDFNRNLKNLWDVSDAYLNSLNGPEAVIADSSGGIYVADTGNNRVLYWSERPLTYGSPANIEFNYNGGLKAPKGFAIIGKDEYLAIADSGNDRVLIFKLPIEKASTPERTISGLKKPSGLFFDGQRLIVADTGNSRVLVWNSVPENDVVPFDLVLGQSSTTGVSPNRGNRMPNYNTLVYPESVYSDGTTLYIADTGNSRILVFNKIPTMNGWHADYVLGQDKFKLGSPNKGGKASDLSLNGNKGLFINGELMFVSDSGNNRIMIFSNEGEGNFRPSGVMGQVNYKSSDVNAPLMTPIPGSLFSPSKIFIRNGIMYVADTANNRVLFY